MEAKVKWYNRPQLVGTILMFWPIFGLYGVYKSQYIDSKMKFVIYGAHILALILLVFVHYN